MTCSVDGCQRTDVNKAQGLCRPHDQRRRRNRPLGPPILDRRLVSWPECGVEGCTRDSESKTGKLSRLCSVHNQQEARGVTPGVYREQGRYKVCQVPGCLEPFRSNKMCNKHSTRARMYSLGADAFIKLLTQGCRICGDSDITKATVDHDHACCPGEKSCGECVRGCLCSSCNLGLGAFRDSPDKLRSAIEYLQKNGRIEEE